MTFGDVLEYSFLPYICALFAESSIHTFKEMCILPVSCK